MKSKIAIAGILVGMSISTAQATTTNSGIVASDRTDTSNLDSIGVERKNRHGIPRHRHADPQLKSEELSEEEREFLAYMDSVLSQGRKD